MLIFLVWFSGKNKSATSEVQFTYHKNFQNHTGTAGITALSILLFVQKINLGSLKHSKMATLWSLGGCSKKNSRHGDKYIYHLPHGTVKIVDC
jgi:hypothetical protein